MLNIEIKIYMFGNKLIYIKQERCSFLFFYILSLKSRIRISVRGDRSEMDR